jgi:Ran GTPase-activating protein (RanGAP) involved in mRNA processing and transport
LDLSYTQPDKKSIQYITAATLKQDVSSPSPSLYNLVLNGCNLRTPLLETLATGIRKPTSSLRQLSIRSNRIANTASALAIGVMLRDYDDNLYGLERLYLDNNDFSQGGIQYIAQALRRNQSLRYLSMCECRIDAKGCVLMGEALKYNQYLERLDIGYNPLCTPNMDGVSIVCMGFNYGFKQF